MKLFIIAFTMLFTCSLFAGKSDKVTDAVSKAFKAKYSTAKDVKWEKDDDIWEAEYKIGDKEFESEFDKSGNWISTEHEIKESSLPKSISMIILSDFSGYKVKEVEFVTSAEHGEMYKVELTKGKKELDVFFDKSGKVIKKEAENEDDEEKEDDD